VFVEDTRVKTGVLVTRRGIQMPALPVGFRGNVARAATSSTLEHGMFDEVRDAVEGLLLVAGSIFDPHADACRPYVGHPLGDDPNLDH
jgi:hypothetical protein